MDRKEAETSLKNDWYINNGNLIVEHDKINRFLEACGMGIKALHEPERSYDEIMVGDIIKNFGCEYEVHSMAHIKDELFISAYRIRGEEE